MAKPEYTPTEARLRERVKGSLGEYAHEFGIDGEAAMDEWIDQALAERDNRIRADERAKQPGREQIDRIQFEIDNVHQIHGDTCLCGFKSSRSRSRTEHLTALFADAVLALEPEAREETGPALRIDDDGAHIYWADPVEGCWVAFRRVDCVGEEELPERRLPAPEAREEPKLAEILARAEEVRQDDGWGIGGAWGDYGEVVVPLRILSYVIEGELDQKIASTDPEFALTYAEQARRAEIAETKLAETREERKHGLIEDYTAVQAPDWTKVSGKLDAREVTDAEVEAAARAIHGWENLGQVTPWESLPPGGPKALHRNQARAALEAAREVSRG